MDEKKIQTKLYSTI